jgi:hypothetical protein
MVFFAHARVSRTPKTKYDNFRLNLHSVTDVDMPEMAVAM